MKKLINDLHHKAEFYKKAAWAHKRLAEQSTQFKKELLELAKEHSASCRYYRAAAKRLLENWKRQEDEELQLQRAAN
jgi:hypothetical protein